MYMYMYVQFIDHDKAKSNYTVLVLITKIVKIYNTVDIKMLLNILHKLYK